MAASVWGSRISSFHNPKPLNSSSASTNFKTHLTISSLPCHHFFRPNNNSKPLKSTRMGISYQKWEPKKKPFRMPIVSCLVEDTPENFPESGSNDSSAEVVFDLKLPRRSLLATFTCNACGVRSQRFINRLAYERGLVYVQCSGCSKYHKLVDNLGLVVEYNLGDEYGEDS
ncbi:PREDICTED: uncharacterized protein LOC109160784 [Ipomoea nil]|uniref:uncharacterized protein LOC109160784 n=1 Tax=Ipomoea nil TaxID=35883 RepID=UPI000901069A|nr:PREDICTED: uncharacterized protein LOC109160784 [Ipomoea nil]